MTPVPLIAPSGRPRYPLVTVKQQDDSALLRDVAAALELHGVPCRLIEEIVEPADGLKGAELAEYLGGWLTLLP